jgi:LysR family transcriptional regulator, low CO2-responsive transcriptional regulator
MEFQQLKGFYLSARLKSLTKAAEKLAVTQSAVTQQIKSLEKELGVKLFDRFGPRKELTIDGQIFFDLIAPLVQDIDNLIHTYEDLKGKELGTLTIAATTVMIMNYLPVPIKKFVQEYPHVKLTILERRWSEIVALTRLGEIDLGIAPIEHELPHLSYFPIKPMKRVLITALGHPLSQKKEVTLKDIAKYPLITYETGLVARGEIDSIFEKHNLKTDVALEATNAETIKRYVEIGIGIGIIPKIALMPEQSSRLVSIPVSEHFEESHYGVIMRKGRHITSWSKRFLTLIDPDFEEEF